MRVFPRHFRSILCIVICLPLLAFGQPVGRQYSRDQLTSDFNLFRLALEESHPGLYRFREKKEMDALFEKEFTDIQPSMGHLEFFRLLTPIISALGCGHTSVRPADEFSRDFFTAQVLPFEFRFINGRALVTRTFRTDLRIEPGSELVAVDGKPIKALVESILPHLPGDGFIKTSRQRRLEQNFTMLLQIHHRKSNSYLIGIKSKNEKTTSVNVALIAASEVPTVKSKPTLEFTFEGKVGILSIRSFESSSTDALGNSYESFLSKVFALLKAKQSDELIIDLRGNGGGRDYYGALLFAYLTTKPFKYYSYLEMKKPTLSFIQHTNQDASYRKEIESRLVVVNGRYRYKESAHPSLPVQQPQRDHFDKKVCVLIDGRSFSATAEFCSVARFNNRATFLGEETGGAYEGNTSGGGVELKLPATGIKVRIPLTLYQCAIEPNPPVKGRGIMADVELEPTIDGILAGKDDVMEATLKLLNH